MTAYYNEVDPHAAQTLRNLILVGAIAPGDVDTRSIEDVTPNDLAGYTQCHFFAGVGLWSYALRCAGWPDHRPVWTGSCPCQPFSTAGKGDGFADERHLWPAWNHLASICLPVRIYGEQVASKDGLGWFDLVCDDLEGSGYTVRAADLCAAGFGAPHIRQRLWFMADATSGHASAAWEQRGGQHGLFATSGAVGRLEYPAGIGREQRGTVAGERSIVGGCGAGGLVNTVDSRLERLARDVHNGHESGRFTSIEGGSVAATGAVGRVGDTDGGIRHGSIARSDFRQLQGSDGTSVTRYGADAADNPWAAADWLYCRDGKWRPVEPGTFPLADGYPARMGVLRAWGNAIVPAVAQAWIEATM